MIDIKPKLRNDKASFADIMKNWNSIDIGETKLGNIKNESAGLGDSDYAELLNSQSNESDYADLLKPQKQVTERKVVGKLDKKDKNRLSDIANKIDDAIDAIDTLSRYQDKYGIVIEKSCIAVLKKIVKDIDAQLDSK